jgi:glycosyltransferase involved in cell wall biosynthesis
MQAHDFFFEFLTQFLYPSVVSFSLLHIELLMKKLRYKVLFLASWYPNRTNPVLGVFVRNKAKAISHVCDVAVLYVTEDSSLVDETYDVTVDTEDGIPTFRVYFALPSQPWLRGLLYNLRFWTGYYKGWKAVKHHWGTPDVVHAHVVERSGFVALAIKYLKGIQYVITEHSTPDIAYVKGETSSTQFRFRRIKKLIYRECGAANVDSSPSRTYLEKLGMPGSIRVIPNVVAVDDRFKDRKPRNRDDGKFIATHISILNERKNVADIIRVFSTLYHEHGRRSIELHILGEGVQRQELEALAAELKVLDTCIFFHGFVSNDEKLSLLTGSDVHILNSNDEGFSVVTAEAIAYGVPVIATRCGGPEDFVTPTTGILIDRRDAEALLQAVLSMIEMKVRFDPDTLRIYGHAHFSPEAVATMTYAMYEDTITRWHAGNTHRVIHVEPAWRVLDIGSGHQPNRRANVILEKYMQGTIHRTTQQAVVPEDKHLVIGDALAMPFHDKAFDFAIASHIAEHVDDPIRFCEEMSRAAIRGYVETPGPLTEYLMPTKSHRWIVSKRNGGLHFRTNTVTKSAWLPFFRFFYLNRDGYVDATMTSSNPIVKAANTILLVLWNLVPFAYTRIQWNGEIRCTIEGLLAKGKTNAIDSLG